MGKLQVISIVALIWSGLASTNSLAQQIDTAVGFSNVTIFSDDLKIVNGTTTNELASTGNAYYEFIDFLGVLDFGYLPIEEYGSYQAYLPAWVEQQVVGELVLLLYFPLANEFQLPVQISFLIGGDSVSATFSRLLATGDSAQIRAFLSLMKETGQLSATQITQLQARLAVVEATESAAATALTMATEWEAVAAFGGPAAFSRLLGMGTGRQAALDKAASITLAELQAAKVTLPIARYWLAFYRKAVPTGKGGDTASARVQLFERIIALLGG